MAGLVFAGRRASPGTDPRFRGQGLAAALIWQLARRHRRLGVTSWLQVACANYHAIELYRRMGFESVRDIHLSQMARQH